MVEVVTERFRYAQTRMSIAHLFESRPSRRRVGPALRCVEVLAAVLHSGGGQEVKKGSGANSLSIRVQWSFRKLRIDCGQTGEHGRVVCRSALRQGSDHFMRALVLSPDDDSGAMLLERCLPRTTLRSQPESARDGIIAAVLNRVWESSTETIGV